MCNGDCAKIVAREEEKPHCRPYFVEFWNTVSNLAFIVAGAAMKWIFSSIEYSPHPHQPAFDLYANLLIMQGICSAIHHAAPLPWRVYTIYVDWFTIVGLMWWMATTTVSIQHPDSPPIFYMTLRSITCWFVALTVLIYDHLAKPKPVPWMVSCCAPLSAPPLHTLWHVFAAVALFYTAGDVYIRTYWLIGERLFPSWLFTAVNPRD
jgi:hypothetical protein